jgi:hypothetical protein
LIDVTVVVLVIRMYPITHPLKAQAQDLRSFPWNNEHAFGPQDIYESKRRLLGAFEVFLLYIFTGRELQNSLVSLEVLLKRW